MNKILVGAAAIVGSIIMYIFQDIIAEGIMALHYAVVGK